MGPTEVVTFDSDVAVKNSFKQEVKEDVKEVEELLNDDSAGKRIAKTCENTYSGHYSSASQMMVKNMGWKQGEGLGKKKKGRKEPIKPRLQVARRGLGYDPLEDEDCLFWWQHKMFEPPTYGGCEHLIEQEIKESMAPKAKQAGPGHLD